MPLSVIIIGSLITFGLMWVLVRSPLARLFADAPDHRKVHQFIVPRIGGLALIVGTLLLLIANRVISTPLIGPNLSNTLFFMCFFLLAAGTLDDVHPIGFKIKFLLQFMMAVSLVFWFGESASTVRIFGNLFEIGIFGSILSVFWIVGLMNAFNIIDGIDGLAGGVAICGLAAIGTIAFAESNTELLWCSLAMVGIVIGFFPFNFHSHTKAFLGDTGSQFLGAGLALLTLRMHSLESVNHSVLIPAMVVGYPIFDVSVAMLRRFSRCGRRSFSNRFTRMFQADNEHLHHRLVYLGLSHLQSCGLLLLLAGSLTASAVILARTGGQGQVIVLGYLTIAFLLVIDRLGFLGSKRWFTSRRQKPIGQRIVGVISGSELFLHSLHKYPQEKFSFLHLPANLGQFIGPDLSAVILYNVRPDRFDEQWASLLRMQEFGEFPTVVIAGPEEIAKVRLQNPNGLSKVRFLEKPGRIPEVIRELETASRLAMKAFRKSAPQERRFSLAELALRPRAP